MEKKYTALIILFLIVIIVGVAGFYKSYFSHFPDFSGLHLLIHLHTAAFIFWFILIVLQPILVKQKKLEAHKKIGKLSYFLVAFIFVSVVSISALWIRQELPFTKMSKEMFYMHRFPGLFQGLFFCLYYVISMLYRRNIRLHVAFIIAATLVVLTPSFGRLFLVFLPEAIGMPIVVLTEFLLVMGIVLYEKVKLNRSPLRSPYLLIAGLIVLQTLLFIFFPQTEVWQTLMEKFLSVVI